MSDQDKKRQLQTEVSKRVLQSMGSFSSDATINWLKNVTEDVSPDQALLQEQNDEPPYMTMVCCVDTLFDHFQRYHWEYNKSQEDEALKIHCSRPDFGSNIDEKVKCQGHLKTKEWALLIEAEEYKILAYIVKSDFLKDFGARREHHTPFMEINGQDSDYGILWRAGGTVIYFDHLSFIAKKFFARLLRVSKGEASELEPFKIEIPKDNKNPNALGNVLSRIQCASNAENADQFLGETWERTTNALTTLQVLIQQDLQEMTKMGIMALRKGDSELNQKLTVRTKVLTDINNKMMPIVQFWNENSR